MRPFRLLAIVALLSGCGSVAKDPSYDSESQPLCTQGPMVSGMDVSHHQGTIDWQKVHSAGFDFAIVKVSEGTGFADPNFKTYWADMKSAGVIRGAYHFFHPSEDGAAQADYFLSLLGPLEAGDLPPMLDWEVDDCPSYGAGTCPSSDAMTSGCLSVAAQVQSAQAFLDEVYRKTGIEAGIYTYPYFWNCSGNPNQAGAYPLWQASYPSTSTTTSSTPPSGTCPNVLAPWTKWTIWQWSAFGSVAGIQSGPIDFDVFNGTLADFQKFAIQPASSDAGIDAGPSPDAGELDAGEPDAGEPDAGSAPVDGGITVVSDAGTLDAGAIVGSDAGNTVGTDAGGATAPPTASSGCSSASGSLLSMMLCFALLSRRRVR